MSLGGVISGPCAHHPPFFNDVHSLMQNIMGDLTRMRESVDTADAAHQKECDKLRKDIEQECHEAREYMNKFRYEFDELVHRRVETVVEGLEEMERSQRVKDRHQQRQIDTLEGEVDQLGSSLGGVKRYWQRIKKNSLGRDKIVRELVEQQHLKKAGGPETDAQYLQKSGERRQSHLQMAIANLQAQKAQADSYALAEQVRSRLKGAAQYLHQQDWRRFLQSQDADGSGQISYREFRVMCTAELKLQEPDENLKLVFDSLDFDSSGEISIAELIEFVADPAQRMRSRMKAAAAATGNDWQKIIDEIDFDKSGQISMPEFRRLCQTRLKLPETEVHLASVFRAVDTDHSGEVSIRELTAWVEGKR